MKIKSSIGGRSNELSHQVEHNDWFSHSRNKKSFFSADSNEWASHKLSRTEVGYEVERLMFDHVYWEKVEKLVSIYEELYIVLHIVDSEVVPTMPFVYELLRLMKTNLDRFKAKEWVKHIITDRWDRTLKHPLHVVGN